MEIIAHRGDSAHAPENTLLAFERAISEGADRIELDLQASGDGGVVVLHDVQLRRLTGHEAFACDTPTAALAAMPVLYERFGRDDFEVCIPTLPVVVERIAPRIPLYFEIKTDGAGRHAGGLDRLIDVCLRHIPRTGDHVIGSFDLHVVRRCLQDRRPTVLIADDATRLDRLDAKEREGLFALSLQHERVDAAVLDRCQRRGLRLWAWTVDRPAQWQRLRDLGALDGWCTNDVGALRRWRSITEERA